MTEIWKEIDDYPDYKVSTLGNIMSNKYGDWRKIKPSPDKNGYLRIGLHQNNKRMNCSVHRLVALAFIPNPDNLPTVDHIDQNRTNNDLSNLRWATCHDQQMNTCRTRHDITETEPTKRKVITNKQSKQRVIDEKRFYCETCNMCIDSNISLQRHYKSKSHLKIINFKPTTKHFCRECGVNYQSKSHKQIHIGGQKHKRIMENK